MDVSNIKGPQGSQGPERAGRAERPRDGAARESGAADGPRSDSAAISATGRETAAAVDGLAERARREDPERARVLAEVRAKLDSGLLDDPQVLRATAEKLLRAGF